MIKDNLIKLFAATTLISMLHVPRANAQYGYLPVPTESDGYTQEEILYIQKINNSVQYCNEMQHRTTSVTQFCTDTMLEFFRLSQLLYKPTRPAVCDAAPQLFANVDVCQY